MARNEFQYKPRDNLVYRRGITFRVSGAAGPPQADCTRWLGVPFEYLTANEPRNSTIDLIVNDADSVVVIEVNSELLA
jgi:hypothetical protein